MNSAGLQPQRHTVTEVAAGQMQAGVYRGIGRVEVEQVPVPEIGPEEVDRKSVV